jgi:hypothetical protein
MESLMYIGQGKCKETQRCGVACRIEHLRNIFDIHVQSRPCLGVVEYLSDCWKLPRVSDVQGAVKGPVS